MGEWAHLEEIVRLIASNLFARDVHRCRVVCRAWRAALAEWPQSPCLMLRVKGMWQFHQHNGSMKLDVMKLTRLEKARIRCSNHGWLLMQSQPHPRSRGGLFFFDPFNGRTIEITGKTPSYAAFHFFNPPTSPECFVVGIENKNLSRVKIGILRRGDDVWPAWDPGHVYPSNEVDVELSLSPPVLRGGFLYFVDLQGNLASLDVSPHPSWSLYTDCLPSQQLRDEITKCFLFQFRGDEALYAVFLIHEAETVHVFRLSEPLFKWEPVEDLGDKMVYLSTTSCFGDTAHSQSMANKIFFPRFHHDDLLGYSLATRKYHSLHGTYSHDCDFHGFGLRRFDQGFNAGAGVAWIRFDEIDSSYLAS